MGLNYGNKETTLNRFYALPLSMQIGVVQDYADSIGYDINVGKVSDDVRYYYNIHKPNGDACYSLGFKTRDEARTAAIKAFDEIVNG